MRDVNGDRTPDWIVDAMALGCAPCGPLGCEISLFLSAGNGRFERAFVGRVTGWRVRYGRPSFFEVSRAAPYCPAGGTRGCSERFEVKGATLALLGRSSVTFGRPTPETASGGAGPDDTVPMAPDAEPPSAPAAAPPKAVERRRRQLQDAPYVR